MHTVYLENAHGTNPFNVWLQSPLVFTSGSPRNRWKPMTLPAPRALTPPHDPPSCWPWSPRNMNASVSQSSLCQVKDLKCHGRFWDRLG